MPDSKISQLESANKIYDHDLMIVVTGYDTEGAYPNNCKISADRIRRDIVRLNEMIFFVSGFSGYYNTGENLFYITTHQRIGNLIRLDYPEAYPHSPQVISTTGLNAKNGNNIDIQFNSGTIAANRYGGIGSPYYSGIVSTTGLNTRTENLIVKEHETIWPYSGVLYQSGLNARPGNNIEVQFQSGSPASNKYGGTEGKYWSGIISTTGLNTKTDNLISVEFENTWPYSGIIYTTGLNARAGNNIEVSFSSSSFAGSTYGGLGGKFNSGMISTTGLNADPGSGIYLKLTNNWPYPYEIGLVKKIHLPSNISSYDLLSNINNIDEQFIFPLFVPTGIKKLNYSIMKCEGHYKEAYISSNLPLTSPPPSITGPNGELISWTSYTIPNITQGTATFKMCRLESLSTPRFINDPTYDYTNEIIITNHTSVGSITVTKKMLHFLAFYHNTDNAYGSIIVSRTQPSCTIVWTGSYYNAQSMSHVQTTATILSVGSITSVVANGHRHIDMEPVS
jgi:hypothetical protein